MAWNRVKYDLYTIHTVFLIILCFSLTVCFCVICMLYSPFTWKEKMNVNKNRKSCLLRLKKAISKAALKSAITCSRCLKNAFFAHFKPPLSHY